MADYIPCSHCDGEGFVELTGKYAETLSLLRALPAALNGAELAKLGRKYTWLSTSQSVSCSREKGAN